MDAIHLWCFWVLFGLVCFVLCFFKLFLEKSFTVHYLSFQILKYANHSCEDCPQNLGKEASSTRVKAAIYIYVASHSRYEGTEAEISQVSQLGAFVELLTIAEPEHDRYYFYIRKL